MAIDWFGNPIKALEQIGGGIEGLFKGGGGGKKSNDPPWDPTDQIQKFLDQYAVGDQTKAPGLFSFLQSQHPQTVKDQSSLATALQKIAGSEQWQPKALSSSMSQTPSSMADMIDPLSIQMFFQNSIAPFLNRIGQDQQHTAQQYSQIDTSHLPPAYRSIMQASNKQAGLDQQATGEASMAVGLNQPRIDQLMQLLAALQKAQYANYAASVRNASTSTPPTFPTSL